MQKYGEVAEQVKPKGYEKNCQKLGGCWGQIWFFWECFVTSTLQEKKARKKSLDF